MYAEKSARIGLVAKKDVLISKLGGFTVIWPTLSLQDFDVLFVPVVPCQEEVKQNMTVLELCGSCDNPFRQTLLTSLKPMMIVEDENQWTGLGHSSLIKIRLDI